jgi:CubicO group peptidase (beta-lactamase class C family)
MNPAQTGIAAFAMAWALPAFLALADTAVGQVQAPALPETAASRAAESSPLGKEIRDLADVLEPIRKANGLPALAGAIVADGRLVGLGAVGQRKSGSPERVTVNDCFHLGSCTKSMTATLIGMLVEEGKLSWDSTIAQVLPELVGKIRPEYEKVTVDQLLRHRSGLPEDRVPDALFLRLRVELNGPIIAQRLKAVQMFLQARAPTAAPGAKMQYANTGYVVVGAMAERVTGLSWEELMRKRLFEPLGMRTAGFGPPGTAGRVDQPYGHTGGLFGLTALEPGPAADNPPWLGPAGTVHASMGDWAKYILFHLAAYRGKSLLIKAETVKRLYRTAPGEDYAMGWAVVEGGSKEFQDRWGHRVLAHAGSNGMWFATVWVAPENGAAVLVATNLAGRKAENGCQQARAALMDLIGRAGPQTTTAPAGHGAR